MKMEYLINLDYKLNSFIKIVVFNKNDYFYYSTVTDFARFLGLSTSSPLFTLT